MVLGRPVLYDSDVIKRIIMDMVDGREVSPDLTWVYEFV